MEEELNYLSEKIEEVEHIIDIKKDGLLMGLGSSEDKVIENLKKEKKLLENILNKITIIELS